MEFKCETCNKNFNSDLGLQQHNSAKHTVKEKSKKINFKRYFVVFILVLIVIFSTLIVYSSMKKPGKYDDLAKCLSANGMVVYGNDYCSYTNQQLNFFGKSKQYLNYVKCSENEALCNEKGITTTPTWEIDDYQLKGVQGFEKLSSLSGCSI